MSVSMHNITRSGACPYCGSDEKITLYWFQDLRPKEEWEKDPNLTCHSCYEVFRESQVSAKP